MNSLKSAEQKMVTPTLSLHSTISSALPLSPIKLPFYKKDYQFLVYKPQRKVTLVRTKSADGDHCQQSPSGSRHPLSCLLYLPRTLWRRTLNPLIDFGFGKRSIWEGGVGLFLLSGTFLLAFALAWLNGYQIRSNFRKYQTVLEFSKASGICIGTPVRIRGVNVGSVVRVNPSLKSIEAIVEVEDEKLIIPRNSLIEVNQSGLLMETMIDIMPRDPIPEPSFGPLHHECSNEGLIVCDRATIKGQQGTSLDELVGIFTRLGREAEKIGIANAYAMAERVSCVIEEAKPLLTKMEAIAGDVQPLLSEVRDNGLLRDVEEFTRSITLAIEELRCMRSSFLTPRNAELLQKSVHSLISILKNIDVISTDIMGFTGDEPTQQNLKRLIRSLSRLF